MFARTSTYLLTSLCAMMAAAFAPASHAAEGMATPWQMNFQHPVTPVMEKLVGLHNHLLIMAFGVSIFVCALLLYICLRFNKRANPVPSKTSHNTLIEIIWTVVPVIILVAIAIPSFRIHFDCIHSVGCSKDHETVSPDLTLKVVGFQWYWNYEYPDQGIKFDSYMKKEADLKDGEPRLLKVDNPLYVPVNANVRVMVTGGDVIHAFAMPAFGVKQDGIPGRLNETWFRAEKEGTYYGQCSELCGRGHGFMPIEIHVVSQKKFDAWVKKAKLRFASGDEAPLSVALQ